MKLERNDEREEERKGRKRRDVEEESYAAMTLTKAWKVGGDEDKKPYPFSCPPK